MVRRLQERAARALPTEHVEHLDGWWLRHTASATWWAGAVLPHAAARSDELARPERTRSEALLRGVVAAERFYARHDAPALFQISPGACPEPLDVLLAQRGYRWDGPLSLQVAETSHVAAQAPDVSVQVQLEPAPTDAWFALWDAVHGPVSDRHVEWAMLERVQLPSAYATAILDGELVGVGRAVLDDGWAGVFGMAALPRARGRHVGRGILAALAQWAAAREAEHLYLQVDRGNTPALRLYANVGFDEVCRYHYRIAAAPNRL